jgi:hypothetical protein
VQDLVYMPLVEGSLRGPIVGKTKYSRKLTDSYSL